MILTLEIIQLKRDLEDLIQDMEKTVIYEAKRSEEIQASLFATKLRLQELTRVVNE